ncbi:MAG: DUF5672 family protein, partial [Tepidisphaeraceae bacterium]
ISGWNVGITRAANVRRLTVSAYSALLCSRQFWELFREEKLLLFQSDSLLCGHNVLDFIGFDFVGAPAQRFDETFVINGGLSLRTRRKMLECIDQRGARPADQAEDVFFTDVMRTSVPAVLPDFEKACRFAVETVYRGHPVGVHGTDKCYHSPEVAEQIVRDTVY